MNGEIYQISFGQFEQMLEAVEDREIALLYGKLASEIIVGMYGGKPLAFVGFTSLTLISTEAIIWMITTDEGSRHPLLFARYAHGLIETALLKYTVIRGRCFIPKSARWIHRLGASFVSETEFEFRRG